MTLKLNGTNSEAAPAYAGDDADTGLQCGTNELKLVTGGTARATVDSSGNFKAHGASILGSPQTFYVGDDGSTIGAFLNQTANLPIRILTNGTEEARFLAGGGLTFNGDTAQANALDDYEEGTWTAGLDCVNNKTGSVSYSNQTGDYVKIGRLCFITINLGVSSSTLGGGNLVLTGLPFPARSENARRGGFLISYTTIWNGVSSAGQVTLRTETNSTESRFNYHTGNLNTTSEPGGGNISSSGGALFISGCYEVE